MARKNNKKPAAKASSATKARTSPARRKTKAPKASRPAPRKSALGSSVREAPSPAPTVAPILNDAALAKLDSGLSKKELQEFREILLERRAQLVGDVTTMRDEALSRNRQDAAGDLSNMPLHMADVGTDNYEQEFTLGLIESERQILREIDDALLRIKAGTFGVCAATGQPIGRARLRATPWAKYCYEYVIANERGRRPRV